LSNHVGQATFRRAIFPSPADMTADQSPAEPHAPATGAEISEAERSTSARIGGALFRQRGWLPVPFLLVPLLAHGVMEPLNWIVGFILIALGEAIRLSGVAAAGTVTRRRSRTVQRLVTYGVFAWMRNPLYVGNFLIWMGFIVISGVLWFLPVAIALFAVEYSLIVRYEEGVLESIFGDEYLAYRDRTSRWFPRPPGTDEEGEHHWDEAWRSEISTFLQYAVITAAFVVKQRKGW
jgi:protein-S-isoprenylcysteine O-methyltransferase Ste14